MAKVSRDVLIVSRMAGMSEKALEKEYWQISRLLNHVEVVQNICNATEVLDIARFKIIRKPHKVREALERRQTDKPFVFLFNKN